MTGNESRKIPSRPAQITVILRLVAGGYLIYLAFGLGKEVLSAEGGRLMLQLSCMVLFLAVGAVLGGWSLKKLIKGEYIHPGEDEETDGEEEADDSGETDNTEETEDARENKTE